MAQQTFVIVGGGLAGAKAAQTLRAEGFDGRVELVGAEAERPYERPPLSKGYLTGADERDCIFVHGPGWNGEHQVGLRLDCPAVELDPAGHELRLGTGEHLGYDRLLLATGSSARRLPGTDLQGLYYLRDVGDADQLRAALTAGGRRVAVVGAGWIGMEVAAAARGHGNQVTVVAPQPVPLRAALGEELGRMFAELHRDHGVDLRLGTGYASSPAPAAWSPMPATTCPRTSWSSASVLGPTSSSLRTPGSASTTGSSSTRPCGLPTRTSTPPATSPTPTARCWDGT